jgi:hypothetical protein
VDVVVDISRRSDGKMWSKGEKIRFVTDYVTRLYERQGERRRPLMQIIDEAARYIPQMARAGDVEIAKCMGAIEQMVEEGRNVGIGVTLITQRSARMNKSVSELAECMIAFRTVGPNSLSAIVDWLGDHVPKARWQAIEEQLRKLPVGQALVVSPGWLDVERVVKTRLAETFDSSATPTGGERRVSGKARKPDLDKYKERMVATVEKAKAEDPRELRRRIAELEKAKAAKPLQRAELVEVQVPALSKGDVAAIEKLTKSLTSLRETLGKFDESLVAIAKRVDMVVAHANGTRLVAAAKTAVIARRAAEVPAVAAVPKTNGVIQSIRAETAPHAGGRPLRGGFQVDGPMRKLLGALAQFGRMDGKKLALLTGYSPKGGAFLNPLSRLRAAGLVERGSPIVITEAGLALGPFDTLPEEGDERFRFWVTQSSVDGPMRKLLTALHEAGGTLAKEELARRCDYAEGGGAFLNPLSRLRRLGLVTRGGAPALAQELLG